MTFYQELQLSSVASKQLIKATEDKKERRRHILIYNFKVYLVMAFCVAVVSLYRRYSASCGACSSTGRFWNSYNARIGLHRRNLWNIDCRTEAFEYGVTGSGILY